MSKEKKLHFIDTIVSTLIMVITVAIVCNNRFSGMIDCFFLPEERNKGYYEYLNKPLKIYESKELYENGTKNLLANYMTSGYRDSGYAITVNPDGSFLFSGRYSGEDDTYEQIVPIEAGLDLPSGDYILSDGGASSEDSVYVRLMCAKRMIGGDTEVITIASLPGSSSFHWNRDPNMELYCEVVIRPKISVDNLKFSPMLISLEDTDGQEYQPCLTINYDWEQGEAVKFYKYDINKEFLDGELVNRDDWNVFFNSLRFQMQADKAVIDLKDGNGIVFQKKDNMMATYGKLYLSMILSEGQEINFADYDEVLGMINPEGDSDLRDIRNFYSYLKTLDNGDYTIIITVRDEGVSALNRETMRLLHSLGVKTNLIDYEEGNKGSRKFSRNSFYSVLKNGKAKAEKVGEEKLVLTDTFSDGVEYTVESSGLTTGEAKASVIIGGKECAMNFRGMNIVIYDEKKHTVIDSVCFDTYSGLMCHRQARQ